MLLPLKLYQSLGHNLTSYILCGCISGIDFLLVLYWHFPTICPPFSKIPPTSLKKTLSNCIICYFIHWVQNFWALPSPLMKYFSTCPMNFSFPNYCVHPCGWLSYPRRWICPTARLPYMNSSSSPPQLTQPHGQSLDLSITNSCHHPPQKNQTSPSLINTTYLFSSLFDAHFLVMLSPHWEL